MGQAVMRARLWLGQWWRARRRRLGLAIYGNPARRPVVLVHGWPPNRPEIEEPSEGPRAAPERSLGLSAADKDYWEKKGVSIYWECE